MSKELRKLYKTALVSINYFFLKIVFKDKDVQSKEINSCTYDSVKRELSILVDNINKENLKDEVCTLFKEELNSGNYLNGKSKSEICNSFKKAIKDMFGCEYPELYEFYVSLI